MFFVFVFSCLAQFTVDNQIVIDTKAPWYKATMFDQYFVGISQISNKKAANFYLKVGQKQCYSNEKCIEEILNEILSANEINILKSQVKLDDLLPMIEFNREQARKLRGSNYDDMIIVGQKPDFNYDCIYFNDPNVAVLSADFQLGSHKTVIYANLSNPNIFEFIQQLIINQKSFILRPTSQGEFGVSLHGYGIELRPFKYSMEYGVKDDQKSGSSGSGKDELFDETIVNFPEILEQKPVKNEIPISKEAFAKYFTDNEAPFMQRLSEISQNPSIALSILDNLGSAPENQENQEVNAKLHQVNHRILKESEYDMFTILNIINKEKNSFDIIKNESSEATKMFQTELPPKNTFRFDYRSKFLSWKNNIEKDPSNKDWKIRKDELLHVDRIPNIKRNLFNVISCSDPTTQAGVYRYLVINTLIRNGYPLRYGALPVFDMNNPLSRKTAFGYAYIRQISPSIAFDFLMNIALNTGVDQVKRLPNIPTEDAVAKAFAYSTKIIKGAMSWHELYKFYSPLSKIHKYLKEMQNEVANMKLDRNMVIFNGKIVRYFNLNQVDNLIFMERQFIAETFEDDVFPPGFDVMEHLENVTFVSKTTDSEISQESVQSLHLLEQPRKIMKKFMKFIKQNFNNAKTRNFMIIFTQNESNYEKFIEENEENVDIILNPKIHNDLKEFLEIDDETIIINGRVFRRNNLTIDEMNEYVRWTDRMISLSYSKIENTESYVKFFMYCLAAEYYEFDIYRSKDSISANDKIKDLQYRSNPDSEFEFEIQINPFDDNDQLIVPIVEYLDKHNIIDVNVEITLPQSVSSHSNNFLRMCLEKEQVVFGAIDSNTVYSIIPHFPPTFVAESLETDFDMDNILAGELSGGNQHASYILTNVLASGLTNASRCTIYLEDGNNKQVGGTYISSTGYWQIDANPGLFNVVLSNESSQFFRVIKGQVFVNSFSLKNSRIVLEQFNEPVEVKTDPSTIDTVDVFSVASGHLYERLTKIMMISVKRHTNKTVKFWILKNFLSPQFKASLPSMSKKYDFEYELISYNWPPFLYRQREKQRIIWANKILFLDNIFPPSLKRVIYIDADQIIRTDMSELMQMDFGDAPYAFTPMCDSRTETEPFRFWKKGYWEGQLSGKKYHISALFAVDLDKFRFMNAGDTLREVYHELSPNPNNLANLDQDLPNNLQDQIPIYSLSQEWLWCETWCSDETMDAAKTIDLCNNPLTHKPKLDIAVERVEEWPDLDKESRAITAESDEYKKKFFAN